MPPTTSLLAVVQAVQPTALVCRVVCHGPAPRRSGVFPAKSVGRGGLRRGDVPHSQIGLSAVPDAFTKPVVTAMAKSSRRQGPPVCSPLVATLPAHPGRCNSSTLRGRSGVACSNRFSLPTR